jgi:hypothetical protein
MRVSRLSCRVCLVTSAVISVYELMAHGLRRMGTGAGGNRHEAHMEM